MKKLFMGLLTIGCLTGYIARAADDDMWNEEFGGYYAPSDEVLPGMGKKAVRGAVNIVTGIVEWPMQTYKGYTNGLGFIKNKPTSKAVGTVVGFLFSGPGQAASRMLWGGMELFGFWTANRVDNKGIGVPLDAQYSWQIGTKYDVFDPTLKEGLKPYGRKLVYGLADGFLGIAELPAQIVAGAREGETVKGIGKGFWYWWSREVYGLGGIGSVLGCLASNPEDNPGHTYKGEWPWSELVEE